MIRALLVLVLLPALALAQPLKPTDPLAPPDSSLAAFEATVAIDSKPGGKRFQGVWLKKDDGGRLLIEYRALGCWTPFDGHRVKVTGKSYTPKGQAIMAAHFTVSTLEIVDPSKPVAFTHVGPIQTIDGQFSTAEGSVGSKMEGSTWAVFTGGGMSYQIANPARIKTAANGPAEVVARAVTRSPFTAHMPGPMLWLLDVTPKTAKTP